MPQHPTATVRRFFARRLVTDQRGVSYLALMGIVVIMGIGLTALSQQWSVTMQREREKELLFRGTRIKNAIEAYAADYEVNKASRSNRYPVTLQQLTDKPKRYLPVAYKDPITGKDFDLIKVNNEIRGVRSTSTDYPLNQVDFKNASTYREIVFEAAVPPTPPGSPNAPAGSPPTQGAPVPPGDGANPAVVPAAPPSPSVPGTGG